MLRMPRGAAFIMMREPRPEVEVWVPSIRRMGSVLALSVERMSAPDFDEASLQFDGQRATTRAPMHY